VVGSSNTANGAQRAFVWSAPEGRMLDLNTRLRAAPAGLVLDNAVAISERGAIVAYSNRGLVLLEPAAAREERRAYGAPVMGLATAR
jgi:probable HAF family extracellular repeat protein